MHTEAHPSPYADADYCSKEYCKIRELIGNKTTTDKQWDAIERIAATMYIYCPENFMPIMLALNHEITWRKMHRQINDAQSPVTNE